MKSYPEGAESVARSFPSASVARSQPSAALGTACPLCGGPSQELARELRRGTGTVFHCAACDLGFLVGDGRDAEKHYATEYRKQASHRADGSATTAKEIFDTYKHYQQERVELVTSRKPSTASVLELGASSGQFLHRLEGYARRCAIEPDASCCGLMEQMGIETDSRFLKQSRFAHDQFDIVCAFQTLEHVDDPVQFLKDARSVLKPDGHMFVEVPNLHDHLRSIWKIPEYERFYFHADHLWYFSERSLKDVARRAGFGNCDVSFVQDYNLLSTLHWLTMRGPQPTCHIGLAPIRFENGDPLGAWLANTLTMINEMFTNALKARGSTSNLWAELYG